MDVREALITEFYTLLTTDATLQALFILPDEVAGTVRMKRA